MSFPKEQISGTLVNYYATCKREAWLYSRKIHARQDDENMLIGKSLSELKENLDDFPYSNLQFDKISKQKGHYEITEYKKTLKNMEEIQNKIRHNDQIYNYILSEEKFNIMMDNINKIIANTIKEDYK